MSNLDIPSRFRWLFRRARKEKTNAYITPKRPQLLSHLVLGVHERKTVEDIQAEKMLRHLLREVNPNANLELTCDSIKDREPPWLFAGDTFFPGTERIEVFARLARNISR
jgi:hypothetical protein